MTMWLPEIARRPGPIADRIVDALVEAITHGQLAPGTQLPPHRELAETLGLSVGTVSRAYNMAREQGLIRGTVGRGTFVAGLDDQNLDLRGEIDLSRNFVRWDPGESVARQLFLALQAQSDLRTLMEVYPSAEGRPEHRQSAAKWLEKRGLDAREDRVVLTNGAQHGILSILTALTKPGNVMATEEVTYSGVKAIANHLGLRLAGLPMDGDGLLPEALDRVCSEQPVSVLYTIPTVQNPTGTIMPENRRQAIAEVARRHKTTIVEDDIYAFLADPAPAPITNFAPERSYFVTSLSKSVLPGLRLGFVLCPPGGTELVSGAVRMSLLAVSPLMAAVGTQWLADGTADRVIAWKRNEIRARWQAAAQIFGFDPARTPSAHVWLPLPGNWQPAEFVARAQAKGVLLANPESFAAGPAPPPRTVRISLGVTAARPQLIHALQRIAELLHVPPAPVQVV